MFSGSIAQLDELLFLFDSWVTCELVMGLSLSLSLFRGLGISIFRKIIFIEILRCCWVAEVLIHTFFFLSNTARAIRAHAHAHTPWPGHRTDEYDSILFFCYFFMNHGNILNEWMNCENKYFNKESSLWKVYSVYMCSCRFSVASSANCWCVLNSCACGDEKRRIKRKTP